jgi:pimeloyl-ACP methyl ester carboxylesterase
MDYNRSLSASPENPKVHLALILVPGIHTGSKPYSTSPLLINPGGPGGSGIISALSSGKMIQGVVGQDQDIIGFDPRGVGLTIPSADCFAFPYNDETEEEDRAKGEYHRFLFSLGMKEIGAVNTSDVALQKIDTRSRALSKLCQEKDALKDDDSIFRHLSTPSVATDMLSIVDAWDEWTSGLNVDQDRFDIEAVDLDDKTDEPSYDLDTKGKLVYWGFSYGVCPSSKFIFQTNHPDTSRCHFRRHVSRPRWSISSRWCSRC